MFCGTVETGACRITPSFIRVQLGEPGTWGALVSAVGDRGSHYSCGRMVRIFLVVSVGKAVLMLAVG